MPPPLTLRGDETCDKQLFRQNPKRKKHAAFELMLPGLQIPIKSANLTKSKLKKVGFQKMMK